MSHRTRNFGYNIFQSREVIRKMSFAVKVRAAKVIGIGLLSFTCQEFFKDFWSHTHPRSSARNRFGFSPVLMIAFL